MQNYEENYVLRVEPLGKKLIFKSREELFQHLIDNKDTIFNCGMQRNTITIEPMEVYRGSD